MSYQATVVEILLAGPGDVDAERREIADAIETWNQRHARHLGLIMHAVRWETDTYPELGEDPQAVINKQLAGRCAAVIAVFATRLGTTTPRAASGTAEEIDRFEVEGKPVGVYFSEGQGDLTRLNPAQLQALQDYKESLRNRGLYRGYRSVSHLRQLIDQHLMALGYRFQALQQAHDPEQVSTSTAFEPTETDMRIIAAIGRSMVEASSKYISSLYLQDAPELVGVSQSDIFESVRVLKDRGLMSGADEPGYGRWEVTLTSDGLEMWLLNFMRDYDQIQRRIATSIAHDDIRDPLLIHQQTGFARTVVEHVLQRWSDRNLVILHRLYDGVRIDRFSPEIQQLADRSISRERTAETPRLWDNTVDHGSRYRTVVEFIGVDVLALSDFGGEWGDPVAAEVRVDGHTVVQVVAPPERSTWDAQVEDRFRSEVRQLAIRHNLLDRQGEVRLVFDPPQSSAQTRDEAGGELVNRR